MGVSEKRAQRGNITGSGYHHPVDAGGRPSSEEVALQPFGNTSGSSEQAIRKTEGVEVVGRHLNLFPRQPV